MDSNVKTVRLDDIWLKASVTGSLWASFEIIAGSLLHNLHIPFSGSLLTGFAIIFMISFYQLWPQRGLIIRAGLICALMKSISPSAVILGPMIGILSEALIIEIVISVAGKNLFSFMLGGSLAMLSSLAHKIVNLLILYGFDLVNVYKNLYSYFTRQIGVHHSSPENLIYILAFIYIFAGIIAALVGFIIGRKARLNDRQIKHISLARVSNEPASEKNQYNILLLIVHIVFIPVALFIFSHYNDLLLNAILTIFYFLLCLYLYKNIARKLLKPSFTAQLLVIIVLASLFMETSAPGRYSLLNGLKGGSDMFLRAILIITAFASISRELLNPVIRAFLIRNGVEKLYSSLQLSFSALPVIVENGSGNIKWLKHPVRSLTGILNDAENWLDSFKKNSPP